MSDQKDPFEETYQVALYQSITHGWSHVSTYYGKDDTRYHSDYVRISEPLNVRFNRLNQEEAIHNALGMINAAEQKLRNEFQTQLDRLAAQRSNLLALTHQPSES